MSENSSTCRCVLSCTTQYLQKALETDTKQNELLLVFPFFAWDYGWYGICRSGFQKYAMPFQRKSISVFAYHWAVCMKVINI